MASAYSMFHGAANSNGASNQTSFNANGAASASSASSQFTLTALNRWSILNKQLPPVEKIRSLHVYDFDNTLFKTPIPNPVLWQGPTIGLLSSQSTFSGGGWWHDSRILAATGQGVDKEEPRAWEGWWNEKIVELVRLSMKQPDALTVLLTGRSEQGFTDIIRRIVASKGLEFDMIGLKPTVSPDNQKFQSTMHFKQIFLDTLMETYSRAEDFRIYEDRPKHTKGFREFLAEFNRRQGVSPTRGPISAEVIQVAEISTSLDPVVEVAQIQHMINQHNDVATKDSSKNKLRIKKTVFFTSYMINPEDSQKLIKLAGVPQGDKRDSDLIYHGNNILICPRPCPASILEKVGGMGSKLLWEVTGTSCYQGRIWAACLRPVPQDAKYHTDNPVPLVVLALKKGARPIDAGKIDHWDPVPPEKSFTLETTVGEKVILRIESDDPKEDEYESLFANKQGKRKHPGDDDWTPANRHGGSTRGYHTNSGGGRGGRGRGNRDRGGRGGRGGRGRGRGGGGGFNNYRSLDDVGPRQQQNGYGGQQMDYEGSFPPLGSQQGGQKPSGGRGRPMGSGGQGAGGGQDLQNYY